MRTLSASAARQKTVAKTERQMSGFVGSAALPATSRPSCRRLWWEGLFTCVKEWRGGWGSIERR
jgi:hypothetical protein